MGDLAEMRQALAAVAALVADQTVMAQALQMLAAAVGGKSSPVPAQRQERAMPQKYDKRRMPRPSSKKSTPVREDLLASLGRAVTERGPSAVSREIGISRQTLDAIRRAKSAAPGSIKLITGWAKEQSSGGFEELATAVKAAAIRKLGAIDAAAIAADANAQFNEVQALLAGGAIGQDAEVALLNWVTV